MTVNETHVLNQALVNEARSASRINISFNPNLLVNTADLGINVGQTNFRSRCHKSRSRARLNIGGRLDSRAAAR